MSLFLKSWALILVLLVFICVSTSECPATDSISGWKINMETAIGGRYDIVANERALRIDSKSFKYSIVACAPQWNLVIWRDDSKEICHCTAAQYLYQRRNAVNTTSSCNLDKIVNKRAITIPRFGLKGVQYVYAGERRGHDLFISDKNTEAVRNYFIDCAEINLPRPVVQLISGTSTLPDLPGFPYQMSEVLENGTRCWQVLTHSLARTTVSPSVFQPPIGYKNLGAFKHAFLFKSVSSMMDDTVDSIGIGEGRSGPRVRD